MIPNKYDPRLKKTEELEATFINGEQLVNELLDFLKPGKGKPNNQSWIITGPRGIGKSHLLTLLARKINKDTELNQFWYPILFPEEVFRIDSLYRLFLFVLDTVFKINEKKDRLPELYTQLNEIKKIRIPGNRKQKKEIQHRLAKESFKLLMEMAKKKQKKFILMIENIQYLFEDQLSHQDLRDLRGILNENPDVFIIIGTALSVLDQFNHYEEPFYQYFRLRKMEPVDREGIIDFLYKIADYWGHEIHQKIKENKSYIYTYQILTDGNPRLILFLYELLLDNDLLNIDRILNKISELTPYFLDKTKNQSGLKTHILDALALEAPTQTASEIAEYLQFDDMRSLASQLKRLVKEGWIKKVYLHEEVFSPGDKKAVRKKEINKKECFYTLRDYFYRIWYKVRMGYNESQDIHCLSELAVFLFNKEEIQSRYTKYMGIDEIKASFYSHSLELIEDMSFMKNIHLLLEDSEKQVKLESVEYYVKIVEENPEDNQAWFEMGNSYAYLTKYEKSIECYQKAVEIIPDFHQAWYNKGISYAELKKYEKSIECFQKAVEIVPDDQDTWYKMGVGYFRLKKYEKAIECFQQAIEIQPDKQKAWYNMGVTYAYLTKYEKSIECFQKAVEIQPNLHQALYNMGISYTRLKKYQKAIKCYKEAVEKKPDYYQAYNNMGINYANLKEHEKAIEYYQKAIEIAPDVHQPWNNMGNSYFNLKNYKKAIECYQKAVKIIPNVHQVWYYMGFCYINLAKYEKSIEYFQKVIEFPSKSITDPYTKLKYFSINRLIEISQHAFSPSLEIKNLLDENKTLSIKITSLCRLLLSGKWIAITDSFESLLKEETFLQENTHILEFHLSAYIIHLLKQENRNQELLEVTRSWFNLIKLLYNDEESKKIFLQFIYYTIILIDKEKLPLEKLEKVLDEGKNSLPISHVLFILLKAIKNPATREAQKWMADPLFKTIVEKLGTEKGSPV